MRPPLVGILGSAVGLLIGLALAFAPLLPEQASEEADGWLWLWQYMVIISGVIFGLVTALLIAVVLQFRGRRGDGRDGPPIHGITWLEITWTLGPTLIVASIVFFSWGELARSAPSEDIAGSSQRGQVQDDKRLEVGVLGYRYGWDYDLPAYGLKGLKELAVPVGQPLKLNIDGKLPGKAGEDRDVIHAFWVPAWRVQMSAVPGRRTEIGVIPTKEGEYAVVCSFICGPGHAGMNTEVSPQVPPIRVVSVQEFEAWVAEQRQKQEQAAAEGGDDGTSGSEAGGSDTDTGDAADSEEDSDDAGEEPESGPGAETGDGGTGQDL